MMASSTSLSSLNQRAVDIILFLLAQANTPTRLDWSAAVEDLFGELSETDQQRMVDAGMVLLERAAIGQQV